MAKFKVGDKVCDTRNGKVGTIVLDNPAKLTYTVDWGGSQTDVPKGYDYLTLANSRASNAKFKVGDIVEVIGQGLATKGKKGRVVKVDESQKGWPYTVSFSGSVSDGEYAEKELAMAYNSRSCNADYIPQGWKKDPNSGKLEVGQTILLDGKIYKITKPFEYSDEVTVKPITGGPERVKDLLHAVQIVPNNSLACNVAPRGLSQSSRLRLKEDFSDDFGSYKKGSVYPIYAHGGISPKYGSMLVPGRECTLDVPWEKLEVVNSRACNSRNPIVQKAMNARRVAKNAMDSSDPEYVERVRRVATRDLDEFNRLYAETLKQQKEHFCYWMRSDLIGRMDGIKKHVKLAKLPDADKFTSKADANIKKVEAICAKVNAL